MAETVTLEQVEKLAERLPPTQQLKLVAHICGQLSVASTVKPAENKTEQAKKKKLELVEQLLSEVRYIGDDSQGEFDAATDLRQLRDERIKQNRTPV